MVPTPAAPGMAAFERRCKDRMGNLNFSALLRQVRKHIHLRLITILSSFSFRRGRRQNPNTACIITTACSLILLFLFLLISFRSRQRSHLHSKASMKLPLIVNENITHSNFPTLTVIRNVTHNADGIFAEGEFETGILALLIFKLESDRGWVTENVSGQPSLHALASELGMGDVIAQSFMVVIKLPINRNIAKVREARSIYRAFGFRSISRIPPGITLFVTVYPASGLHKPPPKLYAVLNMPETEPYSWHSRLPSSSQCNRGTELLACRRVREGLTVFAVAGCGLPSSADILAVNDQASDEAQNGKPFFMFGLRSDCFNFVDDLSSVTRDVWKSFIMASRAQPPEDLIEGLNRLSRIGWGVSERARKMLLWLESAPW